MCFWQTWSHVTRNIIKKPFYYQKIPSHFFEVNLLPSPPAPSKPLICPYSFPLLSHSFHPRVAQERNCVAGTGNKKLQEKHYLIIYWGLGKGALSQKVQRESSFSPFFFLFQPCPKVSPSHQAALLWWWWSRLLKPQRITYHSEQRKGGKGPCHLKTAEKSLSFFSFSSRLGPRGGLTHTELRNSAGGENSERRLLQSQSTRKRVPQEPQTMREILESRKIVKGNPI